MTQRRRRRDWEAWEAKKRQKKQRQRRVLVLIGLAILLLMAVILGRRIAGRFFSFGEAEAAYVETQAQTFTYSNGDSLFRPGTEDLRQDPETSIRYFDGLLLVYLDTELSREETGALAALVDGELVGQVRGIVNFLQLRVPAEDLPGINALADRLMAQEHVIFSGYDYPVYLTTDRSGTEENPWAEGTGAFDEASPGGSNWWAEAIGAYTAWEYSDRCTDYTVGIIDNGFYFGHQELEGRIESLENLYCGVEAHGTHVAGIIGATDNDMGIRGVADGAQLLVADWSAASSWDPNKNYVASGEVLELHKQMVEQGANVINNSWSCTVLSESAYRYEHSNYDFFRYVISYLPGFQHALEQDYASYLKSCEEEGERTALDSMILILDLLNSGQSDFLFVKSAGNGYDNEGTEGYDTVRCGHFNSMTKECYQKHLSDASYSYEELRDHVLIVSSVKNERNGDGQYAVDTGTNYGANVDIWAPGVGIYSTVPEVVMGNPAKNPADADRIAPFLAVASGYQNLDGTSMAAPMVAGSAALLWALDPSLEAAEVKAYLLDYAGEAYGAVQRIGPVPMLNIGQAVQALVQEHEEQIRPIGEVRSEEDTDGSDESSPSKSPSKSPSTSSEAGEPEETAGGESVPTVLASSDTSAGVYRMGRAAEGDGALFYCNSESETLYRLGEGESIPQPFLTQEELGGEPQLVMATEEYLYVRCSLPAQSLVKCYTFDGDLVGEIHGLNGGWIYFENGFLYSASAYTFVYRAKAADGAEAEVLIPKCPARGFTVCDGWLYYGTEDRELWRCRSDGTNATLLADFQSFSWSIAEGAWLDNIYDGNLVYLVDFDLPAVIHSLDLSRGAITDLTVAEENQTISGSHFNDLSAYGTGYRIGSVYIYRRNTLQGDYAIYGYDLDTGEDTLLVSVDQQYHQLTPVWVSGSNKLYYELSEYDKEAMCWKSSLCSIGLDGSGQRTLPFDRSVWY